MPAGSDDQRNAWAHGRGGCVCAAFPCTPPPAKKFGRRGARPHAPFVQDFFPTRIFREYMACQIRTRRPEGSVWFGWSVACGAHGSIAPRIQAGAAESVRCGHPVTTPAGIPRMPAATPPPSRYMPIPCTAKGSAERRAPSMAGKRQPTALVEANGRKHLTAAEADARRDQRGLCGAT